MAEPKINQRLAVLLNALPNAATRSFRAAGEQRVPSGRTDVLVVFGWRKIAVEGKIAASTRQQTQQMVAKARAQARQRLSSGAADCAVVLIYPADTTPANLTSRTLQWSEVNRHLLFMDTQWNSGTYGDFARWLIALAARTTT